MMPAFHLDLWKVCYCCLKFHNLRLHIFIFLIFLDYGLACSVLKLFDLFFLGLCTCHVCVSRGVISEKLPFLSVSKNLLC